MLMFRLFRPTKNALANSAKKYVTSTNDIESNLWSNWQIWKEKVSGTPEDIQKALKTLNRTPKDAEELARLIRHQRRKLLNQDLFEAEELFKKHTW